MTIEFAAAAFGARPAEEEKKREKEIIKSIILSKCGCRRFALVVVVVF